MSRWAGGLFLLALDLGGAAAAIPGPDYRKQLSTEAWHEVNQRIEAARAAPTDEAGRALLLEAIERATAFQEHVSRSAGLEHLLCEAWRRLEEPHRAEAACKRAVELDEVYSGPWYDLGEMYLSQGRLDEAERAFTKVARLESSGPQAVLGPYRLAEVAGARGDATALERHVREALRHGFSFRDVACLPAWQGYYANPALRDSLDKLITVYGEPGTLDRISGQGCP